MERLLLQLQEGALRPPLSTGGGGGGNRRNCGVERGCTAGKTSEPCLSPKTKYRSTKLCKLVPAPIKYDTVIDEGVRGWSDSGWVMVDLKG